MTTKVIVSISVGFGLFIAFIAGILAFAIVSSSVINPQVPLQGETNRKVDWGIIRPRQVEPAGQSVGSKEAVLNAEFGPVNKAALQESKQGCFTRSRTRRSPEQTVVATYQPHRYTLVNPEYRLVRIEYPSATVSRPVANPSPAPQPPQPTTSPPVDPSSCIDGTCALRTSNRSSAPFPTLFFE